MSGNIFVGITQQDLIYIETELSDTFATIDYVDNAVAAVQFDYFLTDTASDIGTYYVMQDVDTGEAESSITAAGLTAGNDQLLFSYATPSGYEIQEKLTAGTYTGHFGFEKSAGDREVFVYWKLFKRAAGGAETELVQSELSGEITTKSPENIYARLTEDKTTTTGDRLVLKVYANVGSTGTDVDIKIYQEGTLNSAVTVRSSSNEIANLYLKKGGLVGGQNCYGGLSAGDDLRLFSTADSTKGEIQIGANLAYFDEANSYVGIGINNPSHTLHVEGDGYFLDSLGVGITPSAKLHVYKDNALLTEIAKFKENSNDLNLTFDCGSGKIIKNNYLVSGSPKFYQIITSSSISYSNDIVSSIFSMDSAGKVGIFSTTISERLTISDSGTVKANKDIISIKNFANAADMDGTESSIRFDLTPFGGSAVSAARLTVGAETDWTTTASTQDSYVALHTALNGTVGERMRINSIGYVGISQTNPILGLHVGPHAVSGDGNMILERTNTADECILRYYTGGSPKWYLGQNDNDLTFDIYNYTTFKKVITIATDDKIGIGNTIVPAAFIDFGINTGHLIRMATDGYIGFDNNNSFRHISTGILTNASGYMYFNIDSNNDSANARFEFAKDRIGGSGGTVLMTLNEGGFMELSGKLAIGTTVTAYDFEVNGSSSFDGAIFKKRVAVAGDYNPSVLTSNYKISITDTSVARSVVISTEDIQSGSTTNVREFIIADETNNASVNNITVSGETGTINGAANFVIAVNNGSITIHADGTNLRIA